VNRIDQQFKSLTAAGRRALVVYLTAGDPDFDASLAVLNAACEAGADVLELGVPFSDPTSDGPVIEAASGRALRAGMSLPRVLELARRLRERHQTPLVLFSYYNPLLRFGLDRLGGALTAAGLDGLLVVDLPPEEAAPLTQALAGHDLPLIRLIAPTTPEERMRRIVEGAGGFLYLITRTGVTGGGTLDRKALARRAQALKGMSRLPVCLGFGISNAADAASLAPLADGVVVGSALVSLAASRAAHGDAAVHVAAQVCELRAALDTHTPKHI
jgi:tryptophan synthase alpha chain